MLYKANCHFFFPYHSDEVICSDETYVNDMKQVVLFLKLKFDLTLTISCRNFF